MCLPAVMTALGSLGIGGATAAGAAAGAAGAAGTLSTIGTVLSIGGSLYQGIQGANAAKANAAAIEQQRATEAALTATKDQRERREFMSAIARQRAELAARGVQLDSVTAVTLGQTAAQEMAFQSQATRAGGIARDSELAAEQRAARAQRTSSLLKGVFSAADSFLTRAPDIWPGLKGAAA